MIQKFDVDAVNGKDRLHLTILEKDVQKIFGDCLKQLEIRRKAEYFPN